MYSIVISAQCSYLFSYEIVRFEEKYVSHNLNKDDKEIFCRPGPHIVYILGVYSCNICNSCNSHVLFK